MCYYMLCFAIAATLCLMFIVSDVVVVVEFTFLCCIFIVVVIP